MQSDISQLESLFSSFVMQSRQRADSMAQRLDEMSCRVDNVLTQTQTQHRVSSSPPSPCFGEAAPSGELQQLMSPQFGGSAPSAAIQSPQFGGTAPSAAMQEATLEGRVAQIASQLDAEQAERRDALRRLQINLADMQSMQHNNGQEMGALRLQLQTLPERENELRDIRDAISGMDRNINAQDATLQTTLAQAQGRADTLATDFEATQLVLKNLLQESTSSSKLNAMLEERMQEFNVKLDFEQRQRQDACQSVQRDVGESTSSSEFNAALEETLKDFNNRLDSEQRQRQEACESIKRDVGNFPATMYEALSSERDRLENLVKEFDKLVPTVNSLEGLLMDGIQDVVGRLEAETLERKGDIHAAQCRIVSETEKLHEIARLLSMNGAPSSDGVHRTTSICDEAFASIKRDVEATAASQEEVGRLQGLFREAIADERERLDAVSQLVGTMRCDVDAIAVAQEGMSHLPTTLSDAAPADGTAEDVAVLGERLDAISQRMEKLSLDVDDVVLNQDNMNHLPGVLNQRAEDMAQQLEKMWQEIDSIASAQPDVSSMPALIDMGEQVAILKQQHQVLMQDALTTGPQARAVESKLSKHIQDSAEQLTIMQEALSGSEGHIDTVFQQVQALRSQVDALAAPSRSAGDGTGVPTMELDTLRSQQQTLFRSLDQRIQEVNTHHSAFQERWVQSLDAERHERKTAVHSLFNDIIQLEAIFIDSKSKERQKGSLLRSEVKDRSATEIAKRKPVGSPLSQYGRPVLSTTSSNFSNSTTTQDELHGESMIGGRAQDLQAMRMQQRSLEESLRSGVRNPVTLLSLIDSVSRECEDIDARCRAPEVPASGERRRMAEDRGAGVT